MSSLSLQRLDYAEKVVAESGSFTEPMNIFLDQLVDQVDSSSGGSTVIGGEKRIAVTGSHATYGVLSGSGSVWSVPEGIFIAGSAMVSYRGAIQTDFTETPATGTISLGFTPDLSSTNSLLVTYHLSTSATYRDSSDGSSPYGALSGTINGTNTAFTTSESGYTAGTLLVWYNGMLQTDVTETTPASGVFNLGFAPATGSVLVVEYEA